MFNSKNRRKTFFIYKPVQLLMLKAIGAACLLSVLSLVCGTSLFYTFLTQGYIDTGSDSLYQVIHIINAYSSVYFAFLTLSVFFTAGLIIYSWLKLSHKIAGPLYRIKINLTAYVESDSAEFRLIELRKNDEMQDLADLINRAVNKKPRQFNDSEPAQ